MAHGAAGTQGVWGAIARRSESTRALARALVAELENGLGVLQTLPPAVTFFGGARVVPTDPYYAAGERMGELLAEAGIPPRTGAGPGIMTAVPEGFRRRMEQLVGSAQPAMNHREGSPETGRPQALTQGFNIRLPFEQSINPAIDVSLELVHFPTRKLMLYENALGVVIFPGGFGTMDELFEIWRLKCAGRLNMPFILFGREFWEPLQTALRQMASGRTSLPESVFGELALADTPEEGIDLIRQQKPASPFLEPPEELGRRIATELVEGLEYLERLPLAVTVLGGSRLEQDDPVLPIAEELAALLAKEGIPTRAAGPGLLSVVLARGGHRGSAYLPQQAFGMRRDDARNLYGADRVHLVNDRLTHKVLLTEGARAFVVLPGGLGTLDEMFSVLCQLQTRKIPLRRLVLVGEAFWRPCLDALRAQMLNGPRRLISPGDLDLMSICDDPAEIARLCLTPPPPLPPRT